ncbi:hypothetical protein NP493_234g02040 [Ridgeia piscesae]|uniref:Uncharacterized protein n=1 Tax=Ridgeia piscesae TaxID=27915 RepID=A0AAD9UDN4_RIDPI|nr:hypothetical protein NP493_234g02040 [Ridgeia piscesae]
MTNKLIVLLLAAICFACLQSAEGYVYKRLTFTFENHYTGDDREFSLTRHVDMVLRWPSFCRKCYYDILLDLQKMFPEFTFTAKGDAAHGQLITHVNGLIGPDKTFWAVFRRTEQGDCLTPLSVSNYSPRQGEHLVLSLQPYSVFNTVPWCPKHPLNKCTHNSPFCCFSYGIGC